MGVSEKTMKKKKIAIIHGQMVIGGAERVLVNMLHHFDYDRYVIHLFLEKPVEREEDGLEHLIDKRVHISYWGDIDFCGRSPFIHPERFACAIAYQGLNYVHLQYLNNRIKANKRIAWIHGDCRYECCNEERILNHGKEYARVDRIFCVSKGVQEIFSSVFPSVSHLTFVHYNLLDEGEITRKSLAPVDDPLPEGLTILSVGRISQEKGHILIPKAASLLKEKGIDFKWFIVGDGDCRKQVEKEIKLRGVSDCVFVKGYRQNPYPYIRQCSLFVLPSFSEGYCTVTLEALLLKQLVVATPVCGINEQIENGVTGLICGNSSSEALADAINRLQTDKQLATVISSNVKNCSFNNVDELQKLYQFIEAESDRSAIKTPLISVVVPVYNVENCLRQMLESVIYQTFRDIEIVCVNDGSTDGSLDTLNDYATYDRRIKVISQPNSNLFVARKNGILQSTGQYVLCIDSDDWLDLEACEIIVQFLWEHPDTDILQYGVEPEGGKEVEHAKRFYSQWFTLGTHVIEGSMGMIEQCYRKKVVPWNIATKVIRGSIAREAYRQIPDVRFGALEDFIGCFYVMNLSQVWRGMDNHFYHYRLGTGMSTNSQRKAFDADEFRQSLGYLEAFCNLKEWAKDNARNKFILDIVCNDLQEVISTELFAYLRDRMPIDQLPACYGDDIAGRIGISNAPTCLTYLLNQVFQLLQKEQRKKQKYKKLTYILGIISTVLLLVSLVLLMMVLLP